MRAEHLYIHVPFCARRCVYCDFSIAVRSRIPVDEYLRALELEWTRRHRDSDLDLVTVYLGGGTPSKLGAGGVARLLDVVRSHASTRQDAEITLEANPEDVTSEAARAWRASGVNRVSLGVQSFEEAVLSWMHRTHTADTARRAVHVLRDEGIDNISIDLIFATPSSVPRSWRRDLDVALGLELPHMSVYGLTVEPHTPLGRWVARRDVDEAPEESFEEQYLEADAALSAAGLDHYEVSNYGRAEAHSKHNWAYWRRREYVGLGPSAHEFDGTVRRWNAEPYAEWVSTVSKHSDPLAGSELLTSDQTLAEELYLNLRTNAGLQLQSDERENVEPWIASGWATITPDLTLRLTAAGWLRLDYLATHLTMLRSRY